MTNNESTTPRPFGAVLAQLLIEKGYVTALHAPNWPAFANELSDVSYESLRKAATGERYPGVKIMDAVARKLGVEPTIFREWRVTLAQRDFDPEQVGDRAYENADRWLAILSSS